MENNEKKLATIFDATKMCKSLSCCECPLSFKHNGYGTKCANFFLNHTEEANDMVLTWLEEEGKKNKVRTYADDFFEKFPKAKKDINGNPFACIKNIYDSEKIRERSCCEHSCEDCWNLPYSSPEEAEKALKEKQ